MTGQTEHMEVAPRMWDKSLAAAYNKKTHREQQKEETPIEADVSNVTNANASVEGGGRVVAAASLSFFSRLKTYLLPAIFVICILVVAYIVWTYFTKYRNKKEESIEAINESDLPLLEAPSQLKSAAVIIASEDTSKYEYDSDSTADDEIVSQFTNRPLSTITEITSSEEESKESEREEDDEDEEEEDEEEEDEEEEEEDEEEEDEEEEEEEDEEEEEEEEEGPDIDQIEELIKNHGGDLQNDLELEMVEDFTNVVEPYIPFELENTVSEMPVAKVVRKARKPKRVTL